VAAFTTQVRTCCKCCTHWRSWGVIKNLLIGSRNESRRIAKNFMAWRDYELRTALNEFDLFATEFTNEMFPIGEWQLEESIGGDTRTYICLFYLPGEDLLCWGWTSRSGYHKTQWSVTSWAKRCSIVQWPWLAKLEISAAFMFMHEFQHENATRKKSRCP